MKDRESETVSAAAATIPLTEAGERLSALFAEHYRRVLRAAHRITGNMADAEDVAQAVFLRVGGGEGLSVSNPGSYLYRAAINGSLDLLRRRKAAATEPLESAQLAASTAMGGSPERAFSNRELAALLRQAISELSPRAAEMFTLRYVEELGNREIAEITGNSQAVIAVTLHRTRSTLKKRLRNLERGNR